MTLIITNIINAAKTVGVNAGLLISLCSVETDLRNVLKANDGGSPSYGICQIKLSTAKMFNKKITAEKLMDPRTNAYYAAKYLNWQIKRYKGKISKAVSAYNAGKYITGNQKYVEKVTRRLTKKYKKYMLAGGVSYEF